MRVPRCGPPKNNASTKRSAKDCPLHGEKDWIECWNCDIEAGSYGFSHHDCGEDCCVCLDPEPNVRCDVCSGKGGWLRCYGCVPRSVEEERDNA